LLKNPECKKHIEYQYSEKFQGKSVFQGKRELLKILNVKSILNINTVKNSRATLFFRASASCSKILNLKSYIPYSENFQGKRKLLKNREL